jgi:Tol biopolymer transport system component
MTNQHTDLYVASLASLPGGTPRRVTFDGSAINGLAWSPDSREIVYASDRLSGYGNLRLWRVPVSGGSSKLIPTRGDRDVFPAIAPDGQRLVYVEAAMVRDGFWRQEIADAGNPDVPPERVIYSSTKEISAEYSPDGSHIVFSSRRSGNDEIWVSDSDGRNPVQLTFFGGPRTGTPRWSPDGRFIVFDSWYGSPRARLYIIPAEGGNPRRVLPDSVYAGEPFWSRDGEWIYFRSEGGIWKAPSAGGRRSLHVSSDGWSPRESPDGKWVYYWKEIKIPLGQIWRKPVEGGDESLVFDRFRANPWGSWVVFDDGMYFVDGSPQEDLSIKFFDFTTRDTTIITKAPATTGYFGYMHVSPDRERLLFRRSEGGEVDLIQLEHWR